MILSKKARMKKLKKYIYILLLSIFITILTGILHLPGLLGFVKCLESAGFPLSYYGYQLPDRVYCMAMSDPRAIIFAFIVDIIFWFIVVYLLDLLYSKFK